MERRAPRCRQTILWRYISCQRSITDRGEELEVQTLLLKVTTRIYAVFEAFLQSGADLDALLRLWRAKACSKKHKMNARKKEEHGCMQAADEPCLQSWKRLVTDSAKLILANSRCEATGSRQFDGLRSFWSPLLQRKEIGREGVENSVVAVPLLLSSIRALHDTQRSFGSHRKWCRGDTTIGRKQQSLSSPDGQRLIALLWTFYFKQDRPGRHVPLALKRQGKGLRLVVFKGSLGLENSNDVVFLSTVSRQASFSLVHSRPLSFATLEKKCLSITLLRIA